MPPGQQTLCGVHCPGPGSRSAGIDMGMCWEALEGVASPGQGQRWLAVPPPSHCSVGLRCPGRPAYLSGGQRALHAAQTPATDFQFHSSPRHCLGPQPPREWSPHGPHSLGPWGHHFLGPRGPVYSGRGAGRVPRNPRSGLCLVGAGAVGGPLPW